MTVAAAATGEHLFWIISRAAGIVALLTASASVGPPTRRPMTTSAS